MMKQVGIFFSAIIITLLSVSFTYKIEINKCYISFPGASNINAQLPDRLPANADKFRTVTTGHGDVTISCIDGYRVIYNNDKKAPFVNLKVELSQPGSYVNDQKGLLENLNHLNSRSSSMESKDLIELSYNGYKIYGLNRASIEKGNTLGTFVMFPGNDITVYFYFNNIVPEFRNFQNIDDYKKLRNNFIDDYTKHLKKCGNK